MAKFRLSEKLFRASRGYTPPSSEKYRERATSENERGTRRGEDGTGRGNVEKSVRGRSEVITSLRRSLRRANRHVPPPPLSSLLSSFRCPSAAGRFGSGIDVARILIGLLVDRR